MVFARILGNKLSLLGNITNAVVSRPVPARTFSSLLGSSLISSVSNISATVLPKPNLNLIPAIGLIIQKCGMKVRGRPKLRCKHCYYAGIDGVLHVFCDKYPRHKQRAITPGKKKYTWLLTHVTTGKYRPY